MAYISYNKLWESEFYGIVSKRDKLQDLNINNLKLEVYDTYKKDEKVKTNFEPVDNEDVINKGYLDSKFLKIDGHFSKLEKDYNEIKLQYKKQSVEEILVQRAVKTTIQILYDRGLFDNFQNAEEVLKNFLFSTRRRPDLSEDNTNSHSYSYHYISIYTRLYIQLYEYLHNLFTLFIFMFTYIFTSV